MPARLVAGCCAALALLLWFSQLLHGSQPLPALSDSALTGPALSAPAEVGPLLPMMPLASEAGLFARWRANHQERAARDGWIETDRPSFTLSDSTVPRGWLQVEGGYTFAFFNETPSPFGSTRHEIQQYENQVPELNLRLGLTNRLELRVLWAGALLERWDNSWNDYYDRMSDLEVGFKYQVSQNRGWIPKSALVASLLLPTGNESGYQMWDRDIPTQLTPTAEIVDQVTPTLNYIYSWYLTDRLSVGGCTGGIFDTDNNFSSSYFFQSAILRYQWTSQVSVYSEFYAFERQNLGWWLVDGDAWFPIYDAGIKWRLRPNLQLDWRVGVPLGAEFQATGVFTGVGISFRI